MVFKKISQINEFEKFKKSGFVSKPNRSKINFGNLKSKILSEYKKLDEVDWGKIRFQSNAKCGLVNSYNGFSIVNAIGWINQIDEIINDVISDFEKIIDSTLPNGWIITQVAIRVSNPGDKELGLHTDSDGEYGIGIFLNDWLNESATTCFLPGTQKWPFTFREITGLPRIPCNFLNFFRLLKSAKNKAGGAYFFNNRTLHGRIANNTEFSNMTILISIFDLKKAPRKFDAKITNTIPKNLSIFLEGIKGKIPKSNNSNQNKLEVDVISRKIKFVFYLIKYIFLPLKFTINFAYYKILKKLK
jgi:putative 2OG-Fe(II) oxygenase